MKQAAKNKQVTDTDLLSLTERIQRSQEELYSMAKNSMKEFLRELSDAAVCVVPGIMTQVRFPPTDDNELRLHIYTDPTESYRHSHETGLTSYCLYGVLVEQEYIAVEDLDSMHFQRIRHKGGMLGPAVECPGRLEPLPAIHHTPRNILRIENSRIHTVRPMAGEPPPITFIVKSRTQAGAMAKVYSHTPEVHAPTDPIRVATATEVRHARDRIATLLQTRLFNSNKDRQGS